jgi:small subunit ribosomal protein S16
MVKVRLARIGAKKNAIYRIVVADIRAPRNGKYLERIGLYDPNLDPPRLEINRERYDYWIGVGARPTDIVRQLVHKSGTA